MVCEANIIWFLDQDVFQHRMGQLGTASLPRLTRHHQVVVGQLNMAYSLLGQLTKGGWRESQAGGWVSRWAPCRAAVMAGGFPPQGEPGGQVSECGGRARLVGEWICEHSAEQQWCSGRLAASCPHSKLAALNCPTTWQWWAGRGDLMVMSWPQ